MPQDDKQPNLFQNWISVIGGILSSVWFSTILVLFILDFRNKEPNPYLGVITYMIAPFFLIASLLLIPLGASIERKQRVKRGHARKFPHIDFNNPVHQKIAYVTIIVTTAFLLFSVVGSYRAYEFTESTTFCGKVCHQVMHPEFTTYQNSPHARVACIHCHIGPGVDWFVRSKLAGSYQVYSVLFKKYHRPIETPVQNLRPAQETCEKCHWPQQFFGAVEENRQYFLSDEKNTEWRTRMLMLVGGSTPPYAKSGGIHWHMNINSKVYYVATDEKRQTIPWIKVVRSNGKEEIFVDEDSKFSAGKPPEGEMRQMDCMDCHNRPSHNFKAPIVAVNEALAYGAIDKALPYIRREAVKVLAAEYSSGEAAAAAIKEKIEKFYQKKYPDVWSGQREAIAQAVRATVQIYQTNMFPQMKASWKSYPDNIGHLMFPGCFRCHDDKHKSAEGKVLTKDCNTCHTIIEQGPAAIVEKNTSGLPFRHPDESEEGWKEMNCFECHSGS
ncbi:MAG: hypothetical protein A2787_01130 [Omnitrophica WOR_2 bacterium RIFCSPHIGHO2_01_FULL_48_9]|nr:MAG: hypothetical protein A2787_01130 [Omnitrophica WOR_2 bacterium RIFCSPHIGHO2_01_FULL_48_9]